MIEGQSGLMSVFPEDERPTYQPSLRRVTFANGAIATSYSADEPERLRGPQHDFCFIAGTLVDTADGPKPIEMIRKGDLIWTRDGLRPCLNVLSRQETVWELDHQQGGLVGTADHPIWVQGKWVPLSLITPGDTLTTWNGNLTVKVDTAATSRTKKSSDHDGFGNRRMDLSLTDTTFITSMAKRLTTGLKIWLVSQCVNTRKFIAQCQGRSTARNAETTSFSWAKEPEHFATNANLKQSKEPNDNLTQKEKTSRLIADNAENSSSLELGNSVVQRVLIASEKQTVYNLTVQETHEYFANGVLVHNCWLDEPASMPRGEETFSNLIFGLRLGVAPWVMITGTPKPVRWLRELSERKDTVTTVGSTFDNQQYLAPTFITDVLGRYEGTRLGRQELYAEWLDDVEGALWTERIIDANRIPMFDLQKPWASLNTWLTTGGQTAVLDRRAWRTIVAVDPPGETAECGIIVASAPTQGHAGRDHACILDDMSVAGRPEEWGRQVVAAARKWNAEKVIVESNQGGDMVRATIHAVDPSLRVEKITAKESKTARAEPVSALYERGHVHHIGFLPTLESQMVTWTKDQGKSPDRMDALVHAVSALLTSQPVARSVVVSPTARRIPV
jgi:phage terminase large subunit-like protein